MRDFDDLDDIDRRISHYVVEGFSNRAIAHRVGIPEGTVKWRLHRLFQRLGVDSRVQFVNELRRRQGMD